MDPVTEKVGCYPYSQPSSYFGRFIPHHFAVTAGNATPPACSSPSAYFGYDGSDGSGDFATSFTLQAQTSNDVVTQNYTGNYARLTLNNWSNFYFSAAVLPSGASLSASDTAPTGSWSNGVAMVSASHKISRPTLAVAPTDIVISAAPIDADAVTMAATLVAPAGEFRYGRLTVSNAYGSQLLPLTIPLEAQYWDGTSYRRNTLDSCTNMTTSDIVLSNYTKQLNAGETVLSGGGLMNQGVVDFSLSAPGAGNNGSVDLMFNLTNFPWMGSSSPSARATFGLNKTPIIYMRENY